MILFILYSYYKPIVDYFYCYDTMHDIMSIFINKQQYFNLLISFIEKKIFYNTNIFIGSNYEK